MLQFLVQQHIGPVVTVLIALFIFFATLFMFSRRAQKKRRQIKGRTCVPPRQIQDRKRSETSVYKLADIFVFSIGPQRRPIVESYFYTEEKLLVAVAIVESLYSVFKNDEYYDYGSFEAFIKSIYQQVAMRGDLTKVEIAKRLRKEPPVGRKD